MSSNEMSQNEQEKKCIDIIKSKFSVKNCFGLTTENYFIIEKWLEEIEPNEKSNEFPDFLFPNGFVELFKITSSKLDKKGAAHKIALSKFEKKNEEAAQKLSDKKPTYRNSFKYSDHSHPNLVNSFETSWNKHIDSLENYRGNKDNGIFLVEYYDREALSMAELKLAGTDGLFIGDYNSDQEVLYSYRLSRDKKLLNWLYQFKDRIEYVIFLTEDSVEIIKLSNILKLLKILPYDYAIGFNTTSINDGGIWI